jgi:uncharacterized MAPEG superfamily protein
VTTDLWMLVASVAWTWLLLVGAAAPTLLTVPRWALGTRDQAHEQPGGMAARLRRASANMNENLPLFAALVLVVHVAGKANETSALGAQVFFYARVVHTVIYAFGVPYVRTFVWAVSVVGMGMVAWPLL